uniref:Spaetzle domain-containing protein n=1 Tax=Graphocephala atropunctata TaxID=36148 RepID=A0A1B6L591_9HEMI
MPDIDWPLCPYTNKIIFPKKAKSNEGLFEFIVNDDDYRQGVRVEACVSGSGSDECDIPGSLALGYRSRCVQKHIQRTLVVLNLTSAGKEGAVGFVTKPFDFPSCCSCVISMRVDVTSTSPGQYNTSSPTTTDNN